MVFEVVVNRLRAPVGMIVLLLAGLLAGCTATATTVMDEEVVTNQKHMSSYNALIIHDLELKRELYTDVPETRMGKREQRYAQMPSLLSEHIQRYVKTYQEVSRDGEPSATTLVLRGRFTRMGRFKMSLEAQLVDGGTGQEVAHFRQTLWDVFDTTEGIDRLGRQIAEFIDRIQYK